MLASKQTAPGVYTYVCVCVCMYITVLGTSACELILGEGTDGKHALQFMFTLYKYTNVKSAKYVIGLLRVTVLGQCI